MAEYFSKDHDVVGTYCKSKPVDNIKSVYADLTKIDDVRNCVKDVDVIIQAAATTSGAKDILSKPYIHVTDNAVMNSLIFRTAFENSIKHIIFFSCSVMYQPSDIPVLESDFSGEIFKDYFGGGWTKVYLEKMCEFYSRLGRNKFTTIRHSNIYGPYDKYDLEKSHVFGATITKVMTNITGKFSVWGDGTTARDLLHVDDLIRFVELAINKQVSPFELVNVGIGEFITVKDLVQKIIQHSGKKIEIDYDLSKPTIPTKLALNCQKAKDLFGWVPQITLDQGIEKTLEWYKKYFI